MSDHEKIEPHLSPGDREELAHIVYLLEQMDGLRQRGVIAPDSYDATVTEYAARRDGLRRRGETEAALSAARTLSRQQARVALTWAERARQLDPARQEAWTLTVDLRRRLRQFDDACALCAEAAQRFPALHGRLGEIEREKERYEAERRRELDQQRCEQAAADLLAKAQDALGEGRFRDALDLCAQLLESRPDHTEALSFLALAHDRLGNFDAALTCYRELRRLQPEASAWRWRARELQRRRGEAERIEAIELPAHAPPAPEPGISWSAIGAEFLKEHWQKLILCLAVLLIVVSSTFGAHHLLGPLLWSPEGKCILALIYTLVFAAFGHGLVKWGARGAGRVMLLTTLAVVPVNFALAGELQLLIVPTAPGLLVLALSGVALLSLCRAIPAALDYRRVEFLALAFFALSGFNAGMAPGVSFGWGFTAFVLLAWVFLGAVWKLNTRSASDLTARGRDFVYLALGLLTYAFLFAALRAGVFVLHLIPTLYALPVMLTAIACAHTAATPFAGARLPRIENDAQRVLLLRYGSQVLAGVAFALALARPPEPSPLFSGNTLATALLGLALFAGSLRAYRQPAYLYLAFAALFVAYFGAGYFIGDVIAAIEDAARRALGYEHPLPVPFKSLNGLGFNSLLALLALQFASRWKDERLARHCHFIGLPLSLAACALSCFEPKAAILCLSTYAALYTIAVWLFAAPLLTYLACAALAGAAYFGSLLLPGLTMDAQALGAAGLGVLFWIACSALSYRRVSEAYRAPLVHASLAMSAIALWVATLSVLPPQPVSSAAALTFFVVALLSILLGVSYPHPALSYLSVASANIGYSLAVVYLNRKLQLHLSVAQFGIAAAGAGLGLCASGAWLQRIALRRVGPQARAGSTSLYVIPLFHLALAQTALAVTLALAQGLQRPVMPAAADLASIAIALALCAGVLVMVSTLVYRTREFAYLAVGAGTATFGAAVMSALIALGIHPLPAALAVAFGTLSLLLYLGAERVARTGQSSSPGPAALYRTPLVGAGFAAAGLTWLFCAASWDSYALVAVALGLTTVTLGAATRTYPVALLAHLALASALGTWLSGFRLATGGDVSAPAVYGLVIAVYALVLLVAAETVRPRSSGILGPFAAALPDFTPATFFAAVVLATCGLVNGPAVILTLLLAAAGLLWLTRFKREAVLIEGSLTSAATRSAEAHLSSCSTSARELEQWRRLLRLILYVSLAGPVSAALCCCVWLVAWTDLRSDVAWVALTESILSLVLWAIGCECRRRGDERFYSLPSFHVALLLAGGVFALVAPSHLTSSTVLPLFVLALMLIGVASLALITVWQTAPLTYSAIIAFVASADLTLQATHGAYSARPGAHGLLMAVTAILLWLAGFLCQRRATEVAVRIYVRPLMVSSLVLAVLAVPLALAAPLAMLLLAVVFLLMVKSFPAAEWLYGVIGAVGYSVYSAYFAGPPDSRCVIASVAAAYALWGLGVVVQRWKPALCARMRLSELGYELPLFNGALAATAIAVALRVGGSVMRGDAWTAHVGLLPALALFYLLMLKACPSRAWVHLSVALFTLSLVVEASPYLPSSWGLNGLSRWLPVGMTIAHLWWAVCRGLRVVETPLCRRLGVRGDRYSEVVGQWSVAMFAVDATLAGAPVIAAALSGVYALPLAGVTAAAAWWSIMLALLLTGSYVLLSRRSLQAEHLVMGLHAVVLLLVWWIGAPASPAIVGWGVKASAYYPLATASIGLATALMGGRIAARKGQRKAWPLGEFGEAELATAAGFACQDGVVLTVVALAFTKGMLDFTAVIALLLATVSFAVLTVSYRRAAFAYAGSGLFAATCLSALLAAREKPDVSGGAELAAQFAFVALMAAFVLLGGAGWLRQRGPVPETPVNDAKLNPPTRARAA